ncbi:MAG: hypothetical protein A2521_12850 [Deltaproteobacteria bacterium RIFOXYD12_FULL_57_12]|nr:MAG: hypothetical protein A2521_12850 [Deltaproteobacteria bacterium RIFOXYD12_FULL_57_12]
MAVGVSQAGKTSVEYGKQLFSDKGLAGSTNDKSCSSCHAQGKGLEKSGKNPKLVAAINQCVTDQLGGEKIDGRSAEIRSLKMYIETLTGPAK